MARKKPPPKPDKRWKRPENRDEMIFQIDATFSLNNWGETERASNARILGLKPKRLVEYSDAELNIILTDLEDFKMILFEE